MTDSAPRPLRVNAPATERLSAAMAAVNQVVLDKPDQIRLTFCALLAGGHILIEDLPGVGKTTLAQAMAIVLGGSWQRIQFTSDLLPADILGVSVWQREQENFEFRPGPVFANVVLADEINRASPRTQSALLEAMAEGQVSIDGHTHPLPEPFFVIATQNPLDLVGTYPLPDSQLDRFLLCTSIGYPAADQERLLLTQPHRREMLRTLEPLLDNRQLAELIRIAREIHTSEPVLDYIQDLVRATREHPGLRAGLSPRAALALVQSARAHALLCRQEFVLPDNVKQVFPALAGHRLQPAPHAGHDSRTLVSEILAATPVP